MYDELIKALRDEALEAPAISGIGYTLMRKAADAIEELLREAKRPSSINEYIERAAIQKRLNRIVEVNNLRTDLAWFTPYGVNALIEEIPAADVRPVVLCKDCLHYEMGVCLKIYDDGAANKDAWQERKPNDFCSYGEKREES